MLYDFVPPFPELVKPKPLLDTDEPICPLDHLACADGVCLPLSEFCDGIPHCADGSDENACSEYLS